MRRCVQWLTSSGAVRLVCTIFFLGGSSGAANAQLLGTETCTFTATAPGVSLASLPAARTLTISTASCTLSPPSTIGVLVCNPLETVVTPLGGSWNVTFNSESAGIVDYTTDDLVGITMSPFSLCGFTHNVGSHIVTSQSFTYNDNTGVLSGSSTDTILSTIGAVLVGQANKTGTYAGSISSFAGPTMTVTFTYDGTWLGASESGAGVPAISEWGLVILVLSTLAVSGLTVYRRGRRSARSE